MPSWTSPVDRAAGYTVTNTDWNNMVGLNGDVAYLYGDTGWTNVVTFTNSWVNFGGTNFSAGYRLIGTQVWLRGNIKSGTINTAAFTLPSGYRPAHDMNFACTSNAAFGNCSISSAGVVTPAVGSNVYFALDGIRFDTLA